MRIWDSLSVRDSLEVIEVVEAVIDKFCSIIRLDAFYRSTGVILYPGMESLPTGKNRECVFRANLKGPDIAGARVDEDERLLAVRDGRCVEEEHVGA